MAKATGQFVIAGRQPLESEAQQTILDLAGWRRWWAYHTFDSRRSQGGFPDLVLVRALVEVVGKQS